MAIRDHMVYGHMVYCIWLESLLITTSDCEMSIDILTEDHLESTKCSETLPSSIKIRSRSAHPTWQHSREPKGDEPKYEGRRNCQGGVCPRRDIVVTVPLMKL